MRIRLLANAWLPLVLFLSAHSSLRAVDHNNVDAGRPLSFDDAEAIAFRERAAEIGTGGIYPKGGPAGLAFSTEFLYGFALNSHLSVDLDAAAGGRAGTPEKDFQVGKLGLGLFHNFNREYGNAPAFSIRGDVALPTEKGAKGVEIRLRGIASKALIQYDRLHLNLDGIVTTAPETGERRFRPGVVLGYSKPIGYPRSFIRTGVAEVSLQTPEQKGTGPVMSLGVGLRQQVTVRSLFDIGIRSDVLALDKAPHEDIQIIAGFSTSF
ncbi:MAG: hypothetical protein L0196_03720 [candidate division Zixibacteria bacterium]|nr:hypothetical protein [candidate division Zixibacteria bacterium]